MDVSKLLDDLDLRLGFCLSPSDRQIILADPPSSVDAFTDVVVIAEGLDPVLVAAEHRNQIRSLVAAGFAESAM